MNGKVHDSEAPYAYRKEIDWSVLHQGISLPVDVQAYLRARGWGLARGESRPIELFWNGRAYPAKLTNQQIDSRPERKSDIVQIRYNPTSAIARDLRVIFSDLYQYMLTIRHNNPNNPSNESAMNHPDQHHPRGKVKITIPDTLKAFLLVRFTDRPDVFLVENQLASFSTGAAQILVQYNELEYETFSEREDGLVLLDSKASIEVRQGLLKIRRLDRTIGEQLKVLYDYRCQICGEDFGKPYAAHAVEAHHIDPFTRSLNNNGDNQVIICPNHHHVIHQVEPVFHREKRAFFFPNGYVETLRLNQHL